MNNLRKPVGIDVKAGFYCYSNICKSESNYHNTLKERVSLILGESSSYKSLKIRSVLDDQEHFQSSGASPKIRSVVYDLQLP